MTPSARHQGCKWPDQPHTCTYSCEEEGCETIVRDDEVRGDEIKCIRHRKDRSRDTKVKWLGPAEFGWQIKVADPDPAIRFRTYVLGDYRVWTYAGKTTVGLLDTSDAHGNLRGTERHYDPDALVTVIRQIKKPRKRRTS